jgi:stage II sporulation protein D
MKRILFLIMIVLLTAPVEAQVKIRMFARTKPVTVVFTPLRGQFSLSDGTREGITLGAFETVALTRYDDRVIYRTLSGFTGIADSVFFEPMSAGSNFSLRAPARQEEVKTLDGSLLVRSFPGSLLVLNITDPENYLPGVVRAEAGKYGPDEYFRTQAVVARTYMWRNINRHELDGFNLCDDTHCQVYPGLIPDSTIISACRSTAGMVIADGDSVLIAAAFHGNCGGETASSSDVWVASYPYLVSVKDPWCGYSASSEWQKSIPVSLFDDFLRSKGLDRSRAGALLSPPGTAPVRKTGYNISGSNISKEEMRQRFGLRSSFFVMTVSGDSIMIRGRGYGHGVGLCQDGAKAMASKGMTYDRITGFYYPGTMVTDIKNARWPERP